MGDPVQWAIELVFRIWAHSACAGMFVSGLLAAAAMRWYATREIKHARKLHLSELREMKEQLLLELKIRQLNGHAGDSEESGSDSA